VSVPTASVASLDFLSNVPPNVPWLDYVGLRDRVRDAVPTLDPAVLVPGVGFGRVSEGGRRRHKLAAWVDDITGLMVSEPYVERLMALGLRLGPAAELRGPRGPRYFEVETPLIDAQPLTTRLPTTPCAQCGHPGTGRGVGWSNTIRRDVAASAPHAFRAQEFTTAVVIDDAVRDVLASSGSDLTFDEVRVVDTT
jgi:hypothetical protein